MKVKKYILPICMVGVMSLQSCENFLDTMLKESYSDKTVWASLMIGVSHVSLK